MSTIVEWSDFANHQDNRSKDGIRNLKLVSGNSYNVRFIGNPLKFYKYFVNNRSAICGNPETCPVKAKYSLDPGVRFAVNVLDRDEKTPANRLKILDVPPSVLKPVVSWWKARKVDPGGKGGCDFNIEVTGQKKMTRYTVTALDLTPFTDEEKEYIKANIYDLVKIHKSVPEEEIEDRLFGKREGQQQGQQQGQQMSAKPTAGEDGGVKSSGGIDLPF